MLGRVAGRARRRCDAGLRTSRSAELPRSYRRTARRCASSPARIFGARSPVADCRRRCSPTSRSTAGARCRSMPNMEERALYLIVRRDRDRRRRFAAGPLLVFRPGDAITLAATSDAHLVLLGGAAMDGPRHIWWNFVSSRKERIEQAKADWKPAVSTPCRATRSSSFRCRINRRT